MPFTVAEIEKSFTHHPQYPLGERELMELRSHVNYPLVIDYLTGKASSLSCTDPTDVSYRFRSLLGLLKNVATPDANDQLILDLFSHPDYQKSLANFFAEALFNYAIRKGSAEAFQASTGYLNKLGYYSGGIFNYLLTYFSYKTPGFTQKKLTGSAILEFLLEYLAGHPQALTQSTWADHELFNFLYLWLLEQTGTTKQCIEYALRHAASSNEAFAFITTYKEGFYLAEIEKQLQLAASAASMEPQERFLLAFHLYEQDANKFGPIIVKLSWEYLDAFLTKKVIPGEEKYIQYDPLSMGENLLFRWSACAIHLLLTYERESFRPKLNEIYTVEHYFAFDTVMVLFHHLGAEALPYLLVDLLHERLIDGLTHYQGAVNLLTAHFEAAAYVPTLWKGLSTKQKQVRSIFISTLLQYAPDIEEKAIALLDSRNASLREAAAQLLRSRATQAATTAILSRLQKEKNDNARDELMKVVESMLPLQADTAYVADMIAGARERNKLTTPIISWLDEQSLPALYYTDGEVLPIEAVRFLLYRMSRVKEMRSDREARLLIQLIDKQRSGPFGLRLLELYLHHQAKPEQKFLLALAALLGDDTVVDKIRTTTNQWLEENRTKMAEYGIRALALHGSNKALRWVEWYSRKYQNKKAIIGATALAALELAAEELGISIHELGDRIVPDFGFEGLFKYFTADGTTYRAFIDGKFKIKFFDEDNNSLKTIPAASSAEIKEEFKEIAKEVRDVVKGQSLRLENYLITQRSRSPAEWKTFFLENPIMFIYATRLVWGTYIKDQLSTCFICEEDTTLVNEQGDEIILPEEGLIRLVHPIGLSPEMVAAWQRYLFNASIEPAFPQLDRAVISMSDADRHKKIVFEFVNKRAKPNAIKSTLEKRGWQKGGAQDGGGIYSFHYIDPEHQIEAILEVTGVFVAGYTFDTDNTSGRLYFMKATRENRYWMQEPKDEADERLIELGTLSPIFYSEVMAGIRSIPYL